MVTLSTGRGKARFLMVRGRIPGGSLAADLEQTVHAAALPMEAEDQKQSAALIVS
jgi:hypothetical protein